MDQQAQTDQAEKSPAMLETSKKGKNEWLEWLKAIIIAVVLVLLIRWLVFAPFIVDGPSMHPNFHTGERIIVNKFVYDIRKPNYGDVIVFYVPSEKRDFIKRVIGLPGDTVMVNGDTVWVNGKVVEEPYLEEVIKEKHEKNELYNNQDDFPNDLYPEGVVPEGHVFVLGDNRSNSTDSRRIGYVALTDIVGRADLVFWPLNDFKFIK